MPIFDLSGWNVKTWKYNSRNIEEQLHKKNAWIAKNYKRYQIEEISLIHVTPEPSLLTPLPKTTNI